MAYIVIQGKKGFVSLVEKGRVRQPDGSNPSRTIRGICGLGNMTKEEYLKFQSWAHSYTDQEERKVMVLASGRAIVTKETAVKAVAEDVQRKTTVKRPPIQKKKAISKVTILDKAAHQDILDKEKRLRLKKEGSMVIESKKDIREYSIKDLKTVQELEAENKTLRGMAQRDTEKLEVAQRKHDVTATKEYIDNINYYRDCIKDNNTKRREILHESDRTGRAVASKVIKGDVIITEQEFTTPEQAQKNKERLERIKKVRK